MLEDLMNQYIGLITRDHHKGKDMYFRIEKCWCRGKFEGYRVVHDGYCNEIYSSYFDTYAKAEAFLIKKLHEFIDEEERCIKEFENE